MNRKIIFESSLIFNLNVASIEMEYCCKVCNEVMFSKYNLESRLK